MSDIGIGLTKAEILHLVTDYVSKSDQKNKFANGVPGVKWYRLFINRWSHVLSTRLAQNLPINRATAITTERIEEWFKIVADKIEKIQLEYGKLIPAENYWNTDESGFSCDQGRHNILTKKG